MRLSKKIMILCSAATIALAGLATPAAAAEADAAVVEKTVNVQIESGRARATALASCQAIQRVDYAHMSKTSSHRAVQSHGNWENINCNATHAVVTTRVLKRNVVGIFVAVGDPGVGTLVSESRGLTSSNRVTAHYACANATTHTFRSWTDVDIVGIADLPNRQYSPARELPCN